PEASDTCFASAAEKFFRPEFFNRLDRVIPFRPLERKHLEGIARQLLAKIFARDGLQRRDGLLNISPSAMARVVQLGHHPQLGARALKRVIEREVAQPIGEKLANLAPGTPIMSYVSAGSDGFLLQLRELKPVARSVFWTDKVA